jgi:hypothetical protein
MQGSQGRQRRQEHDKPYREVQQENQEDTHSDLSAISGHTGHNIGSRPLALEEPRIVPGNAWCYDCEVPIVGNYDVDNGFSKRTGH